MERPLPKKRLHPPTFAENHRGYLCGLATAVPKYRYSQDDIREGARRVFGARTALFMALEPVYGNAEIKWRYSCQPEEWFSSSTSFAEKSRHYEQHATALAHEAGTKALEAAGLEAADIDAIVFVSSTGVATPTIDARLMNLMPFRRDTLRLPIFGLGCAGGVLGLNRATQLVNAQPKMRCLFITVELCTLAFRYDRLTKGNLVATALFGDGAAAAVIASEPGSIAIGALGPGGEYCWHDTLDVMGWRIDEAGFDVVLDRRIPDIVHRDFRSALDTFLERENLRLDDITRPCCHPGGAKVVSALEAGLGLKKNSLDFEREILRDYGNMSAPTVLFVLERVLRAGIKGPILLSALGPGFTAAFQILSIAGDHGGPVT
jgi:alkylresorcinol/alkylpyrone synthase